MANSDIVVIGSGHNGLVAAAYLAAAGKRVTVLERNPWFGGGVVTRELTVPGFRAWLDRQSEAAPGGLLLPAERSAIEGLGDAARSIRTARSAAVRLLSSCTLPMSSFRYPSA